MFNHSVHLPVECLLHTEHSTLEWMSSDPIMGYWGLILTPILHINKDFLKAPGERVKKASAKRMRLVTNQICLTQAPVFFQKHKL